MGQHIRTAIRHAAHRRGFSAIVIVTVALGVGATTTFFTLFNGLVLRPLPYADPDRLVSIRGMERGADGGEFRLPYSSYVELATRSQPVASAVAYIVEQHNVTAAGTSERVDGVETSGDLFQLLGAALPLGRAFRPEEHATGAPVAIIGHALWARHFRSNDTVIGATISINGTAHTIIGVAPPSFVFPGGTQVWRPLGRARDPREQVSIVARLAPGVSLEQASAHLTAIAARLGGERPGRDDHWQPVLTLLHDVVLSPKHRTATGALLVAALVVLAVACANLAGLMGAQLALRRHELAVRAALGARRAAIVAQLLTESVVLSIAGGILGIVFAHWGVDIFIATLGRPIGAEWLHFPIDARVLVFAVAVSLGTAVLFGVVPATRATRVDLRGTLQEDSHATAPPQATSWQIALVVPQMAVSLALIAGAASIVTSAMAAGRTDPGFDRERLLSLRLALAGHAYDDATRRLAFISQAVDRLEALPGAAAVTVVSHAPLADRTVPNGPFMLDGWTVQGQAPHASLRWATSGYASVLGIPVRRGRFFTDSEAGDPHAPVVVVNETMALRYWPNVDPVGARVYVGVDGGGTWLTVIGVVGDVAQRALPAPPENQLYLPLARMRTREVTLVLRAAGDASALIDSARKAVAIDPSVAITAQTIDQSYAWYVSDRRTQGVVVGALGVVAISLAALGLYAVVALFVTQQRREIAVRIALGSSARAVFWLVLRRGARVTAIGVVAGLLCALAVTRLLSSVFFGLRAFDPMVLGTATLLLALVALFASWWPARRATRVFPLEALRALRP